MKEAFESYAQHKKSTKLNSKHLVVVDFSKPSSEKRLVVYDIKTKKIIRSHHVAHGSKSNCNDPAYACHFSNVFGSRKSSLGAMKTGSVYTWGKSFPTKNKLKLHGLEPQNSNVYVRAIVIHSSNYVTDSYIAKNGRAGNSWGCLAVDPAICDSLIDLIKEDTFIYCHK